MESVKKILPFILVAIVFAIAGYFVGVGGLVTGDASIYKQNALRAIKDPNISSTGPTGGDTTPAGFVLITGHDRSWCGNHGGRWVGDYDFVDSDNIRHKGSDGCEALKANPNTNAQGTITKTGTTATTKTQ